jgi:membrane-associated phospholipid phosphatase
MIIKSRLTWPLALIGLVGFLVLVLLVGQGATLDFDRQVTHAFQRPDPPGLLGLMEAVSWPGDLPQGLAIGLLIAAAFALARRWAASAASLLALLTFPLTLIVKGFVARPRPSADLDGVIIHAAASGTGFPSAHVLCYMALGGFLAYLAATRLRGPLRPILLALALALLLLIGPARIYLGEHWFADVLASYFLGLTCLVALIALYRWAEGRRQKAEGVVRSS